MLDGFLKTPYGLAIFIAVDVVAVLTILAIGYRWMFKRFFDLLFSGVSLIVVSPLLLFVWIRGKAFQKNTQNLSTLTKKVYRVGKKERTIALHEFRTLDDDGDEAGKYGAWLARTGLYKLLYLVDVFLGRLSFIGVRALDFVDAAFLDENLESRFFVRAGLIHPSCLTTGKDNGYDALFESEIRYEEKLGLFGDLRIFFVWLVRTIRGEKNEWLGETRGKSYADLLLEKGEITKEDYDAVKQDAEEELAALTDEKISQNESEKL
jgi:lipopolysaccharide/colanic/teichoic acid biosynthesis glycosyltransferase